MQRLLVCALALSLSGSSVLAQSLHDASPATDHPLEDSVRAEASNFAAGQTATAQAPREPIKIGVLNAITGPLAVNGSEINEGIKLPLTARGPVMALSTPILIGSRGAWAIAV